MKRIIIVGATSAMAEHCARLWVAAGPVALTLIGRDAGRTERVAADLRVRSPGSVIDVIESDFLDVEKIEATVGRAVGQKAADIVLIAHGSLPDQTECENSLVACRDALEVNGLSPVLFAEAFAQHLARAGRGTLVLIGSVAGDRGRRSNYIYGAAKGLVARYAQGLQHRFASSGVKIVLVKPGPTDTPMTAHLKQKGAKMPSVESVAANIVAATARGSATAYVPGKWRIIMTVIRLMPNAIFNKINI